LIVTFTSCTGPTNPLATIVDGYGSALPTVGIVIVDVFPNVTVAAGATVGAAKAAAVVTSATETRR
jgi:hypothetical protein